MPRDYVEQREGGYYIADSRVSLESIVYAFQSGDSAEAIAESFHGLTLEQVHGALAFYLSEREKIDEYLHAGGAEFERLRSDARRRRPALYARIEAARGTPISPRG